MTAVDRVVNAEPSDVWAVLADGWLYPLWVVGASRMREVDDTWPGVGARLYHSAGEAEVDLRLGATAGGTEVTMIEDAVSGPGTLVPKPLRSPLLARRNVEALRRLALLVENRQRS